MAGNQDIPLIGPLLNKVFGSRNERFVKRYTSQVEKIDAFEPEVRKLTDEQIRGKLAEFRERREGGESMADLLSEVFAVAREAMDRHVGIRNVLDPARGFDPGRLPEAMQEVYRSARAEAESLGTLPNEGRFLGNPEPVPAWRGIDLPPEFYEAVRELYPESRPPFRARPFGVQLTGGIVLSQGKIAEMKTGEGKTIVAPLATYLAAVERLHVHVVTVNDYLVQRDRDWTAPFFEGLGLTVGAIHPQHTQPEDVKRQMYRCDVVYGTTSEFGFDFLRDNMKQSVDQQVQRRRDFAIVDEVDSMLIDEARTPLIISGMANDEKPDYAMADRLARHLMDKQRPWQEGEQKVQACKQRIKGLEGDIRQVKDRSRVPELQKKLAEEKATLPDLERERDQYVQYYEVQLDRKAAYLTHDGIAEAQKKADVGSFYVGSNMDLPHLLEQAVRAHAVYQRDRDYIVAPHQAPGRPQPELSVIIVDQNTGRPMPGRQWSDGLHQAVESKEGVPIKEETQTVATVTIQNFFKMYKRLAGMTGTADTEAQEFYDIYKLDVVQIPTNKPIARADYDDLMFLREKDKWQTVADEIKRMHDIGRPVLVGTTSVENSEKIATILGKKHGVKHSVLNAKQHEREAHVVEDAGQLGAVMIATNMAGRGTDIKLGPASRQDLLDHWLRRGLVSREASTDMSEEALRENCYRKIAPGELGVQKRDAEQMAFEELELVLLRKWAADLNSWLDDKKVQGMSRDQLADELDRGGRFLLHRLRWFDDIEDMGGLHVIGTERHESRRIDNQLRGRSGRQGDNGSSRFYISLEDDLMKMFAGETQMRMLSRFGMREGDAIEHGLLSKSVERAQRKVEERNFQRRKQILEYDEVMEHQRRSFYGLRQRVLEGRDVKGLIFDYIEEAIDESVTEMLGRDFRAQRAAEYAAERLDTSIEFEKLRGKDLDELERTVRRLAIEESRANIVVTLGEYIPMEGSEIAVEFDSAGLVRWAKNDFGVEIDAGELREGGAEERRHVQAVLEQAAEERIEAADLSGLSEFVDADYGYRRLAAWVERKFGFTVTIDELRKGHETDGTTAAEPILTKARDLYRRREIEYPVQVQMTMTRMAAGRPGGLEAALGELAQWARRRFGAELDAAKLRTIPPQKLEAQLFEYSEKWVDDDVLSKAIDEAVAIESDDELDTHLTERFGQGITDRMRYLEGEDRDNAVRARVENLLRAELLGAERGLMLQLLDDQWRQHLYGMDQLRDSISFRAFSQQDPRIAYKREGSQLFSTMMSQVRDRVTDLIFRVRFNPQAAMMNQMGLGGMQQAMPAARPAAAPAGGPTGAPTGAPGGRPGAAQQGSGGRAAPAKPFDPFAPATSPRPAPMPGATGDGGKPASEPVQAPGSREDKVPAADGATAKGTESEGKPPR